MFVKNKARDYPRNHPIGDRALNEILIRGRACKDLQHNRRPRIVLYSHDTMGLGHIRRNLLIGQVLSSSLIQPDILLVSGTLETSHFVMPQGLDCIVMPSLHKDQDGKYQSRRLQMSLDEIIAMRRKMLMSSISAFEPDILIVDNVPLGAAGELDSILENLRFRGRTRCVLGLRDVLDESSSIQLEWRQKKYEDAIRKYYDEIWVYGDAAVYDTINELNLASDIAAKVHYTGYLDQRMRLAFSSSENHRDFPTGTELPEGPYVLCEMGGGQDGARLAEAFAAARLPEGVRGILLTGPHMDPEVRQRLHDANSSRLLVLDFVHEPTVLLQHAACVVAMGGYNTVSEIMSFGKRALIVPRVVPRKEQLVRAQRLESLGIIDMLHPDHLEPEAITEWIKKNVGRTSSVYPTGINMNGLECLSRLISMLLDRNHFTVRQDIVARAL